MNGVYLTLENVCDNSQWEGLCS